MWSLCMWVHWHRHRLWRVRLTWPRWRSSLPTAERECWEKTLFGDVGFMGGEHADLFSFLTQDYLVTMFWTAFCSHLALWLIPMSVRLFQSYCCVHNKGQVTQASSSPRLMFYKDCSRWLNSWRLSALGQYSVDCSFNCHRNPTHFFCPRLFFFFFCI